MDLLLKPISQLRDRIAMLGGVGLLLLDTALMIRQALFGRRGRRLGWSNLWFQMDRVGVKSIGIVSLVQFCIGSILALQMAPILDSFGMVTQVADIISVAVFRELGPLVSAIVLTGFAGASIAAEIGTMTVSEELEALESQAISPVRFLFVPRILATTIMMVCVAVVGDIMGVVGGLVSSLLFLGINPTQYLQHTFEIVDLTDFITGLVKAAWFGTTIAGLACYLGMNVTGGAQGVGVATTRTVVLTIVSIIAIDLLFTAVFYFLGL